MVAKEIIYKELPYQDRTMLVTYTIENGECSGLYVGFVNIPVSEIPDFSTFLLLAYNAIPDVIREATEQVNA